MNITHWRHRLVISWLPLITLEVAKINELKHERSNKLEKITRKTNVRQNNHLIEFTRKIIELKNESESPQSEKIMRKTSVSQDSQLQDFISRILKLSNDNDSNKIENIMR